jgi:hypothetical protein
MTKGLIKGLTYDEYHKRASAIQLMERANYGYQRTFKRLEDHAPEYLTKRLDSKLIQADKFEKWVNTIQFKQSDSKGNFLAKVLQIKLDIMTRRYEMTRKVLNDVT